MFCSKAMRSWSNTPCLGRSDRVKHPPSFATKILKAAVYLVAMMYLFLGVSIVADRFMAAIEVITSQERELTIVNANGEPTIVLVRIWNETVSNLTLMALGSSAPEILLSVIEIFANNFEAGDLGPGTIVGSAAFNLFCIVAICIAVIPSGESRRIERNDVFWVTVVWSTFAYVWLYLILCVFSPNIVELTWLIDTHPVWVDVSWPGEKSTAINLHVDNPDQKSGEMLLDGAEDHKQALIDPNIVAFQEHRSRFIRNFQQMRLEHPDLPLKQIGRMATFKSLAEAPKSRAFRRVEATRQLTAACTPTKRLQSASSIDYGNDEDRIEPLITSDRTSAVKISFKPSHYICAEDVGILKLYVKCDRSAVQIPNIVTVNYYSVPGSAKEHEDFEPCRGSITFAPDQDYQEIHIKIVDNDVYEFDEEFYVRLTTPKAIVATNTSEEVPAELGTASEALIIIVDDDHGGHFGFGSQVYRVNENEGYFT
uniref:Calx-beta domain-containing protein n=1 Tax=Ditylenchus dipsaci TaxID=166011 RepID=A0A915DPX1_9BILA